MGSSGPWRRPKQRGVDSAGHPRGGNNARSASAAACHSPSAPRRVAVAHRADDPHIARRRAAYTDGVRRGAGGDVERPFVRGHGRASFTPRVHTPRPPRRARPRAQRTPLARRRRNSHTSRKRHATHLMAFTSHSLSTRKGSSSASTRGVYAPPALDRDRDRPGCEVTLATAEDAADAEVTLRLASLRTTCRWKLATAAALARQHIVLDRAQRRSARRAGDAARRRCAALRALLPPAVRGDGGEDAVRAAAEPSSSSTFRCARRAGGAAAGRWCRRVAADWRRPRLVGGLLGGARRGDARLARALRARGPRAERAAGRASARGSTRGPSSRSGCSTGGRRASTTR